MAGVLAGNVSRAFGSQVAVSQHIKAGRLRVVAVTSNVRSKTAPDIPTATESGYNDYHATGWCGIL